MSQYKCLTCLRPDLRSALGLSKVGLWSDRVLNVPTLVLATRGFVTSVTVSLAVLLAVGTCLRLETKFVILLKDCASETVLLTRTARLSGIFAFGGLVHVASEFVLANNLESAQRSALTGRIDIFVDEIVPLLLSDLKGRMG